MLNKEIVKYLAGWEIDLEDKEKLKAFLLTQGVNKKDFNFFSQIQSALELHLKNNTMNIYNVEDEEKKLIGENINVPIFDWEDHKLFSIEKCKNGNHTIGGEKPNELVLPHDENLKTPFQYLGTIDGTDPFFKWMNISKLHIIYPIFECNFGVFFDYSDPLQPKIIEPKTFDATWYEPEMGNPGQIEFRKTTYKTNPKINIEKFMDTDDVLICGVPLWYQSPEIPICPVTGEIMKFVCTINSDRDIEVVNKEQSKALPFSNEYLCFGDYGHLYLFYNPNSKILHANWQW